MTAQDHRTGTGMPVDITHTEGQIDAPSRSHIWYFDWIRLFAMLAVIYMHAASSFLRGQITPGWHAANLLTALSFTAVPLFFMISGALLLSDERTTDVKLLFRRRLPRVLLPLLVFSVIAVLWVKYRDGQTAEKAVQSLLMGLNKPVYRHLWYSYTLAGLYLVSPFLYRMVHGLDEKLERYLLLLLGAVVLLDMIAAFVPADSKPFLRWKIAEDLKLFGGHMFAFLLGYYLYRTKRRFRPGLLIAAALLIWAVITVGTWCSYRKTGDYIGGFLAQNGGWELLLAACLFLSAKQLLDRPRRVQELPGISLAMPIYLSHNLILSFLNWKYLKPDRFLEVVALWVLTAVLSWTVSKTLTTVPGLCYISSGIPWKKACDRANWIATFRRLLHKNKLDAC